MQYGRTDREYPYRVARLQETLARGPRDGLHDIRGNVIAGRVQTLAAQALVDEPGPPPCPVMRHSATATAVAARTNTTARSPAA